MADHLDIDNVPPHNLDAERAVLGSVIIDATAVPLVADLEPADFYSSAHQRIWETILQLNDDQAPIDLMTLSDACRKTGQIEDIGGLAYLASLEQYVMTTANVAHHANILKEYAACRSIWAESAQAHSKMADHEWSAVEAIDHMSQKFTRLQQRLSKAPDITLKELRETHMQTIQQRRQNRGVVGIPTGLIELNRVLGGLEAGNLYLIAARPSIGKTALGVNIALNAAKANYGVHFISIEMDPTAIFERLLSQKADVNLKRMHEGRINDFEMQRLGAAADEMAQWKIWIEDAPGITMREIAALAKQRQTANPDTYSLVVVDYLQLVRGSYLSRKQGGRNLEVAEISQRLKQLARELKVPVMAMCQLSRQVEQRGKNAVPQLSDLRDSGALEQDADVVIFIHRDMEDERKRNYPLVVPAALIIAKQRNGPTGMIEVQFQKETARFVSVATHTTEPPEQDTEPAPPDETPNTQDDLPF